VVDALTLESDEGRSLSAKSFGELTSKLRSENIRMGKPHASNRMISDVCRGS